VSARDDLIDAYRRAELGTLAWGLAEFRQALDQVAADAVADAAAKDTHTGESTLSRSVLGFLTAVRDALTVPRAAPGGDFAEVMERRRRRDELIADRATSVRITAGVAADLGDRYLADRLDSLTQYVRDYTTAAPVDFEVRQDPPPADGGDRP
jgi:hypothetical protein